MAEEKRFAKATWQIMEQLLEVDNLDDALSGSLEIIVNDNLIYRQTCKD